MAIRPQNVQVRFADDPPAEDPSDSSSGFHRRSTVQAIALVVLVLAVYAASARGGFIFNDAREIASNPALRTWREGLRTIWLYPASMPHLSPVAYTFMLVEMKLVGGRPMGFRAASVALHAAVVLLLWALLSRLDVPGAFLAAALFAVHPAQVETVTWAGQQRLLLCAIFYVAGLLRWARRDEPGPGVVALSILAILCQP